MVKIMQIRGFRYFLFKFQLKDVQLISGNETKDEILSPLFYIFSIFYSNPLFVYKQANPQNWMLLHFPLFLKYLIAIYYLRQIFRDFYWQKAQFYKTSWRFLDQSWASQDNNFKTPPIKILDVFCCEKLELL